VLDLSGLTDDGPVDLELLVAAVPGLETATGLTVDVMANGRTVASARVLPTLSQLIVPLQPGDLNAPVEFVYQRTVSPPGDSRALAVQFDRVCVRPRVAR
jgi:hypothetical protein